jgi:hypothetical protein
MSNAKRNAVRSDRMSGSYGVRTRADSRKQVKQYIKRWSSSGKISEDLNSSSLNTRTVPAVMAYKSQRQKNKVQLATKLTVRNYS